VRRPGALVGSNPTKTQHRVKWRVVKWRALSGSLAADVALPAQELGDLCLDGGLHHQAGSDPADLLQNLGEVALRRKSSSISARMRSVGDTRFTDVVSFR